MPSPWVVHRLDKEVSGVILFARNADAHAWMNDLFSTRKVRKAYRAVIHGVVQGTSGVIDRPVRQFGSGRMGIDEQHGNPCTTEFTVLDRLPEYSIVHAHPITGTRHQIRVHFQHLRHPLVGDDTYGQRQNRRLTELTRYAAPRQMLHAYELGFVHPRTGKKMRFSAPIPADFEDAY